MNIQQLRTCTWFIYMVHTTKKVFLGADTTTIRLILAWGSLASSAALAADTDKFLNPVYQIVRVFGSEWMWALYFFLHFLGVHWRICIDPVPRPRWAIGINLFGFLIWFIFTAGLSWAIGSVGITSALAFIMCAASAWALYRTGLKREIVTL